MFGRVQAGLGILFVWACREVLARYPFLPHGCGLVSGGYFPSFSEGLSLRGQANGEDRGADDSFPFLFGGTFIEGSAGLANAATSRLAFPFLFGGTFIEGAKVG